MFQEQQERQNTYVFVYKGFVASLLGSNPR